MLLKFYQKFFLNCISSILFFSSSFAQINNLQFERISSEAGLSQSTVLSIYQDSKGFMWFGTYDGLNRYDGYEFKVYKTVLTDPYSISSNSIDYIFEDHFGVLWLGTGEGLNMFDPEKEQFIKYLNDPADPHSISHNYVRYIYEDHNGTLWLGTHGGGLNCFNRKTQKFTHYLNEPDNPKSLAHNNVLSILEDHNDNLWIGTDGGLCLFDRDKQEFTTYKNDPNDPNSLSADGAWRIFEDSDSNLWIGTWGNGLNRFDKKNKKFIHYTANDNNPFSISNNVIRSIAEDKDGNLWIGTDGGGLNILRAKDKLKKNPHFICYKNDISDPASISSNQVLSIFQDKSGVMWVGCNFGGVNKYNPGQQKFAHYKRNQNNKNSINNNSISSVYEDNNGIIWLGTTGGGLNRFDRKHNKFTHYVNKLHDKNSLSNNVIRTINEDKFGRLWIGSDDGLNLFDRKSGKFRTYLPDANNPNSISYNTIWKLMRDNQGDLWIGTMSGFDKYDYKNDEFVHYLHDPKNKNSLSGNYIWSITQDKKNNLWIGTNANGVNRFNPQSGFFTVFRNDPNNPRSLSSNKVISLFTDISGTVWIGTTDGLNKWDPIHKGFTRYNKNSGLPNNSIQSMLEDDHGNLWIGTNNGLSKFNPRSETFKNFYKSDGLQSNEFAVDACFKLKSGEMIFGGMNGFNIFYPDSIKDNPVAPAVVITNFKIFNKPVSIGEQENGHTIISKSISESRQITLSYKDNVFSFEFSALHYASPNENLYAYMLEGFDKDWTFTNADRRFATYTNLSGGDYIFRVKGSNNDEIWNNLGTSVKVTIIPPFWETAWFRILTFLIIAFVIYVVYKIRIRKIEAHRRELEQKVEERTYQLSEKAQALLDAKKETDNILNNVKEGFFVLNNKLEISSQYSAALEIIFQNNNLAQLNLLNFLDDKIPSAQRENTKMYLELLMDNSVDEESVRDLNPLVDMEFNFNKKKSSGSIEKKYLDFFFKRIETEQDFTEIFVTVRDVTKQVQLTHRLKDEELRREKLLHLMLSILDVEPHMLSDFRESTNRELNHINKIMNYSDITDFHSLLEEVHRSMHLIKGNARLLKIDYFAEQAHKFEDAIEDIQRKKKITNDNIDPLRQKLFDLNSGMEEMEKVIEKMGNILSHNKNNRKKSNTRVLLQSLENLIKDFSKDLGKKVKFKYENFKSNVIPGEYQLLVKEVLIQLVRNSISHGIENPEEREKLKKPVYGKIELSTIKKNGSIGFRLRDDGRGLQLKKLKEKAINAGKYDANELEGWSDKQIADLIFMAGLSTSDSVDMVSGRGVGMDSVIHRLKEHRGEIYVKSSENQFCEFEVLLPVQNGMQN